MPIDKLDSFVTKHVALDLLICEGIYICKIYIENFNQQNFVAVCTFCHLELLFTSHMI